jgi:hypothetical protein
MNKTILDQADLSPLETADAPVREALILVCEKCGKKMMKSGDSINPALEFQQKLKSDIKERFGKGVVRAVSSSCLDVCPDKKLAIAVATPNKLKFFTLQLADIETVRRKILNWF